MTIESIHHYSRRRHHLTPAAPFTLTLAVCSEILTPVGSSDLTQSNRPESQLQRKSGSRRTCRCYIIFWMISSVCLTLCYLDLLHKSDSQIDWADYWKNNVTTTCPAAPRFSLELRLRPVGLWAAFVPKSHPSNKKNYRFYSIFICPFSCQFGLKLKIIRKYKEFWKWNLSLKWGFFRRI